MHMLEGMGIETGVDLGKLIDCVWMLEKMIGRYAWGHVSRCGPRPIKREQFFDANAPFVETVEQAHHFRRGNLTARPLSGEIPAEWAVEGNPSAARSCPRLQAPGCRLNRFCLQ